MRTYDMRDTELSHTQRRDHFRAYDERYALELERDESLASVPVSRLPKPDSVPDVDYDDESVGGRGGQHVSRTATMIYNLSGDFVRRPSIPDDVWSQAETEVRHALTLGGPRSRDLQSAYRLHRESDAGDARLSHLQVSSSHEALSQPNVTQHVSSAEALFTANGEMRQTRALQRRQQREQVFTSSYQRESRLE